MSKVSVVERELKRRRVVGKYSEFRDELSRRIADMSLTLDERRDARIQLQKLPRNSSPVRLRSRCALTGRSRGVLSKFGIGRSKLRELVMSGQVPGVHKASW